MLMKKYNVAWTPGTCVDQVLEISIDGGNNYTILVNDMLSTVFDYIIQVDATVDTAFVRIGSRAPGIATIYSDSYAFKVKDEIVLTAATGLSVTYIGQEDVV